MVSMGVVTTMILGMAIKMAAVVIRTDSEGKQEKKNNGSIGGGSAW